MDEQILRELEIAAQILLAPPNIVTHQQRQAAETVFLNLKKTKPSYILCKYILETSKVDYVLFEVADLLKDALIREWTYLQKSDIDLLRQYLLQYVTERSGKLPVFVREKVLQVIAVIVKRGSTEDGGVFRGHLLDEIENLIMNGDQTRKILGCGLIASLVQEYAITAKSRDIGLTWKANCDAKKQFEVTDLKRIFQFCCRALDSLGNSEPPFSQETFSLVKQFLALSESILTWDFADVFQKSYILEPVYESNHYPLLTLSPEWRNVILESNVVTLFFTVYWKIRSNPQLSHHALTCLVQLASLNGTVFDNIDCRTQYLTNYVEGFVKLVRSVEILDREALGISNIVRKLLSLFSSVLRMGLPSALLHSFLEQLTLLTCNFAEGAATEETVCADDRLYMEAFDHMLEGWLDVLSDPSDFWKECCVGALTQIFNVYLKCHLAPPEGTRGEGRDLELEELDESDETDRIKFKDQLLTIGEFGRHCPEHCMPLLARLLEDRTKHLCSHFDRLHQQQSVTISDSSSLVFLFEDLHWLLLISGNVISVESVGETTSLPKELMKYSISQSSSCSIDISLQVFGSPNRYLDEIQGAEQKTDHLIRLVSSVFRLSFVLKRFVEAKMVQFLSPEVISSMLWFLNCWSRFYLFLNEETDTELSMPFVCAFGRDSEGGIWAINYLLEQVVTYLVHFNSEPGVTQDAVNLFISLVDSKEKGIRVLKSENLMTLIKIQSNLPHGIKRGVMKGLTLAGLALPDEASGNEYWDQILKPLQNRLQAVLSQENFIRVSHEEHVKTEVLDILESMMGVAMGMVPSTVSSVFQYLSVMLSELPTLMRVYYNYQQIVESILTVSCTCVDHFVGHPPASLFKKLFDSCLNTIQAYAKCNSGRLSLDTDSQDDSFTDILLLMVLLTNVLNLKFIEPVEDSEPPLKAVDVCLYGLNAIMPLMTIDLLKYPALCLQYFKLITLVCYYYPEKVCLLPENLLKTLLQSVELGLNSFGQEVIPFCCDFIHFLAYYIYDSVAKGEVPHQALKPFLKLLLNLVLSHQLSADSLPDISSALFALLCCYQEEYSLIVQSVVASQTDPVVSERLAKAFNELTKNITLDCEMRNKRNFHRNFENFILSVSRIFRREINFTGLYFG